jgi:hypothetical protein
MRRVRMSKPNIYCGECPVFLADAEGGAECDACICNGAAGDNTEVKNFLDETK